MDDQTPEQIKETRGDFGTPGTNSPYRDRPVEENLRLFEEMKEASIKTVKKCFVPKLICFAKHRNA